MARKTYHGTCLLCGKKSTKAGIARHLKGCVVAHPAEKTKAKSGDLVHLRVESTYSPLYWLDIELPGERTLQHLDQFLRSEWLECCGHLSSFSILPHSYGDGDGDRSMDLALKRVLPEPFYCDEHGADHECGEDGLMPVVDSPRMGVCAYGF
jgi:hypothetical protein